MKVKLKKHTTIEVEVEVDFPYYFMHDLTDQGDEYDSFIYGKMENERRTLTIHEIEKSDEIDYEIKIDNSKICFSYLDKLRYASSKDQYDKAVNRALLTLNKF